MCEYVLLKGRYVSMCMCDGRRNGERVKGEGAVRV
jgi:hypothetical protein